MRNGAKYLILKLKTKTVYIQDMLASAPYICMYMVKCIYTVVCMLVYIEI